MSARVQEEIYAQRDQLTSVLEAHLSLINLRQNEISAQQNQVVRQLTLVATVFLPLTFITGFYGQNFGWLVRHIGSFEAFAVLRTRRPPGASDRPPRIGSSAARISEPKPSR